MRRFLPIIWCAAALLMGASVFSQETGGDTFVKGSGDPLEAFQPVEGLWLLLLGSLAIIAVFSCMLWSKKVHRALSNTLDVIDTLLTTGERRK